MKNYKKFVESKSSDFSEIEKTYIDIANNIFDVVSEKFKDRFFPLKVKLVFLKEYYIDICMACGWCCRISDDEEKWLLEYTDNIKKEHNIHVYLLGDGFGGKIIYEKSNKDFPTKSSDYFKFPPDPYPERD